MRFGKHLRQGMVQPFVATSFDVGVEWSAFDNDLFPPAVRSAVQRATQSGEDADFLAALPVLDDFLSTDTDYPRLVAPSARFDLASYKTLLPPVRPRTFICIGLNYVDHARESKMDLPPRPLLFAKTSNALAGHGSSVRTPSGSEQLDYEAELAVVISQTCCRVPAATALDYVAGYTCANDISARDFQFADGQWYRGKSCDGFGPLGPVLVTKTDIPDPRSLAIRCRVNGETVQDSTTANLYFGVPELIEFISRFITLNAGDVIATGTPPGVGFARKPPLYLRSGQVVEVEIENIGVLRNTIEREAKP
jgi:2-keto-4-pentenoate hydratase/2-oxohepta-3-ene-1,7-dioic acid hydratase in catechol pathway